MLDSSDGDWVVGTSFVNSLVGTCVVEAEITTNSDGGSVASSGVSVGREVF